MLSEFLGESEAAMRGLFVAAHAVAPTVLFLDEIDTVAPAREGMSARGGGEQASGAASRVLSVLLTEMESTHEGDGCVFDCLACASDPKCAFEAACMFNWPDRSALHAGLHCLQARGCAGSHKSPGQR
jgi:SpoVK/Ycf46/Vps4 family AAA+-type ATPase